MGNRYRFTAELWEWEARANWYFVSLPEGPSAEVGDLPMPPRGFGSIPVQVTIGASTFTTSIFPATDGYALPVKKAVREREGLEPGGPVDVEVEIVG